MTDQWLLLSEIKSSLTWPMQHLEVLRKLWISRTFKRKPN